MRNRMFVLLVAAVLAVGLAWAGGEKGKAGKMDAAAHAAKLQAKLSLSDAQTEQVRAVLVDIQQQMTELRAQVQAGELTREAKHEAKKKLKEERNARLKAIFTSEQFARYQELLAEHARKRAEHKNKQ
ncbi:MAG: hypothetical protein ACE5MH_03715 [Terriglobia bacterium]